MTFAHHLMKTGFRRLAQMMLALFGSTYVCEQTFSVMNVNKAGRRSQLTDQHLRSIQRIATANVTPDIDALATKETNNTLPTEICEFLYCVLKKANPKCVSASFN